MVDLSCDKDGQVRARLLDLVLGRSGPSYGGWITAPPEAFRDGMNHATLDPFHGYANALRDHLSEAVQVLDAWMVSSASPRQNWSISVSTASQALMSSAPSGWAGYRRSTQSLPRWNASSSARSAASWEVRWSTWPEVLWGCRVAPRRGPQAEQLALAPRRLEVLPRSGATAYGVGGTG